MHEEERKERDHSEIFIPHERWVSFVSKNFHNIINNFTFIIIYNIVQHHLSDLTSLFSTSFQVTHAKIIITIYITDKKEANMRIWWKVIQKDYYL